jgi:thiol-disulfide isomerase/thioredoxin
MLVAALVTSLAAAGGVTAQPPSHSSDTLAYADLSWSMMSLAGERITLEAFRGRVIIVNSWATWCEPCVAELRSMTALRAAVPDSALVFVLVAPQQRPAVQSFVRRRGLRLPVYLETSRAPAVYHFEAVPTTWIIDRAGRIVERHRGATDWNTPAVRARLLALLGTPASGRP